MSSDGVHTVIHRRAATSVCPQAESKTLAPTPYAALAVAMGFTTDFIGHIDITPSLNEAEQAYLSAFSLTRHYDREEGPYYVSPNPYADQGDRDPERANQLAPGQPQIWCRWVPCWDGCCLALDGEEKIYQPTRWLDYLARHFLVPDAEASRSGLAVFDDFTFDHRLDGLVLGCRRDNKQLFAIRVEDNVITEDILRPADARYLDYPPLPYEEVIDRDRRQSGRRRSAAKRLRSV